MIVTGKAARVARPRIRNGSGSIRSDDVDIEVDEALAGDGPADATHAVRRMAGRARETVVDVPSVFAEAGVRHDLGGIVALHAKGERSIHAEVRAGKEIRNQLAGSGGLTELVTALQDVCPL